MPMKDALNLFRDDCIKEEQAEQVVGNMKEMEDGTKKLTRKQPKRLRGDSNLREDAKMTAAQSHKSIKEQSQNKDTEASSDTYELQHEMQPNVIFQDFVQTSSYGCNDDSEWEDECLDILDSSSTNSLTSPFQHESMTTTTSNSHTTSIAGNDAETDTGLSTPASNPVQMIGCHQNAWSSVTILGDISAPGRVQSPTSRVLNCIQRANNRLVRTLSSAGDRISKVRG